MTAVRVLVVDDEPIVRDGLSMILATYPAIEVVGTAADGAEALAWCRRGGVDVMLLDIRMPRTDGLEVLRGLRALPEGKAPQTVVLTTFDLDDYIREALTLGACGFLLKSSPHERIAAAVHAAAVGDTVLSETVLATVVQGYLAKDDSQAAADPDDLARLARLTVRELQILRLLGQGYGNSAIAEELFLSLHTVKTHVSRILQKTGSVNRGRAAALAHRCQRQIAEAVEGR